MKPLLLIVLVLIVAIGIVLALVWPIKSSAPPVAETNVTPEDASNPDLARLSRQLDDLTRRLDRLERARDPELATDRSSVRDASRAAPPLDLPGESAHDPRWYLDQYVLSFDGGGPGSEYYRLVVDAHAADLVAPICELVRESSRPLELRLALVPMLARGRFRGDAAVVDALLAVLRSNGPDPLAEKSLDALAVVVDRRSLMALESLVFALASPTVRTQTIRVVLRVAGEHANASIQRLLAQAPNDDVACELIGLLDASDREAALLTFRGASVMDEHARLCAAYGIAEFQDPPFRAFVAEWLQRESDERVIAALTAATEQQQTARNWSARQVIGPPDSDPRHDDTHAWASAQADMGLQWIQLVYAAPMVANGVRIHEVNVSGAVAEILACNAAGEWVQLWSGSAGAPLGSPLSIGFPATTFAVRTLRLVLDTNRAAGWNEIDAVELVGPGGRQWVADACASSSYGQGGSRGAGAFEWLQHKR